MKSVQILSFLWSVFSCIPTEYGDLVFSANTGKYRPEETPYLDTFHAVICLSIKLTLALIEAFMLDKMKIKYNSVKSSCLQRTARKSGFQIFIVYLNFIAPDSTLMTFNSKRFMYRTYFSNLNLNSVGKCFFSFLF